MNFVNLTPHDISIHGASVRHFPKSGQVARCATTRVDLPMVDGIAVSRTVIMGEVDGLPAQQADTVYLVSALVAQACPDRADLYSPGEAVRDAGGVIVGAKGLCFYGK